jgi:hypothetical protein
MPDLQPERWNVAHQCGGYLRWDYFAKLPSGFHYQRARTTGFSRSRVRLPISIKQSR